jgi:RNA polymerase sigma-70 factor (ECF subfamily)
MRALEVWPFQGIPDNPEAWLIRVAKNKAIDWLRRDTSLRGKIPELERRFSVSPEDPVDDQLAMMFLCCHPRLPENARLCLMLKTVGGLGVREIARAFLSTEEAIAQRLVRAKRRIQNQDLKFEMPLPAQVESRLETVLRAIYLVFNEGYSASGGEDLIRSEMCDEAIYLARLLTARPLTASPAAHALLALLLLQGARLPARRDAEGDLLLLDEQDRGLWDQAMIGEGMRHLDFSAAGGSLTSYHLEAGIAAEHCQGETDWATVVTLYDTLCEVNPSPVVLLNRAVAVARRDGPEAGLAAVEEAADHVAMHRYYLLYATRARLLEQCGRRAQAAAEYRRALECATNAAERRFLERRLSSVQ